MSDAGATMVPIACAAQGWGLGLGMPQSPIPTLHRRRVAGYTSSPIERINSRALLRSTTPGRMR